MRCGEAIEKRVHIALRLAKACVEQRYDASHTWGGGGSAFKRDEGAAGAGAVAGGDGIVQAGEVAVVPGGGEGDVGGVACAIGRDAGTGLPRGLADVKAWTASAG